MLSKISGILIRHGQHILPESKADWGHAMTNEAASIADETARAKWALGCVVACYSERLRAEHFLLPALVRMYVACVCVAYAFGHFTEEPYRQWMCALTGQYRPIYLPFPFTVPFASYFYPHVSGESCYFMRSAPLWVSLLVLTKSACFLATAVQIVRGRVTALLAFCLGWFANAALSAPYLLELFAPSYVHILHFRIAAATRNQWQAQAVLFGLLYPFIFGIGIALLTGRRKKADP